MFQLTTPTRLLFPLLLLLLTLGFSACNTTSQSTGTQPDDLCLSNRVAEGLYYIECRTNYTNFGSLTRARQTVETKARELCQDKAYEVIWEDKKTKEQYDGWGGKTKSIYRIYILSEDSPLSKEQAMVLVKKQLRAPGSVPLVGTPAV